MLRTAPFCFVPSSLVRMMPVTPALSLKLLAREMAFWPVDASSTKKTSCGGAVHLFGGNARSFQFLHQVVFGLQAACGVHDQQVGLAASWLARTPKTTAPGSAPGSWAMISTPAFAPDLS